MSEKPTASDDIGPCYSPNGAGGGTSSATGTGTATGTGSATNVTTTNDTVADTSASATQGVDSTMGTTVGSTDTLDSGTETGSTTGSMGCVDNSDCTGDPSKPICVGDTCTTCDKANDPDAACADATPDTPACVGTACVECSETTDAACGGNTPHCDTGTSTCVACTEHAHCPDTACKIPSSFSDANDAEDDEGSCFTGGVIDLDETDNLNTQIGMVADGTEQVFRLANGNYTDAIVIDGGKTIALLAANPEDPVGPVLNPPTTGSSTISVTGNDDGTRLFLYSIDARGNLSGMHPAIEVDNARLYVQRGRLVQNSDGALSLAGGAYADIENSFLAGAVDVRAVDVAASSASFLYTTLGTSMVTDYQVVACTLSPQELRITNSVVVKRFSGSAGNEICASTTLADSSVVTDSSADAWFVDFNNGDFHLAPGNPFGGVATWHDGDPLVDIDGDARPAMDGVADVAGADIGP